jgi:hypothetical protein
VQVNRACHQGRACTAGASQDVWSVAVIALELLSATPITHQTGVIPGDAHQVLAEHFEVLARGGTRTCGRRAWGGLE